MITDVKLWHVHNWVDPPDQEKTGIVDVECTFSFKEDGEEKVEKKWVTFHGVDYAYGIIDHFKTNIEPIEFNFSETEKYE
jgi:hypothetical protein